MIVKVKNCLDCPFNHTDEHDGHSYCTAPKGVEDWQMTKYGETEIPINCPLVGLSILITHES